MNSLHTIIFGGTKGMGRVLARSLLVRGQTVTVLGRSAADSNFAGHSNYRHFACDFLDAKNYTAVLEKLKTAEPRPNYLVFFQRFRGEGDRWQGEIETSLNATRLAIEGLADSFAPDGEKAIVLVSSVSSRQIASDQPLVYHLAKAGLAQMAQYYAVTLGHRQIRVNAVSPGTTIKPESEAFYTSNAPLQDLFRQIVPLGRMGRAEDVTNVIEFLCSPASAFVTGQNIFVDGGVSLHLPESLARRLAKL